MLHGERVDLDGNTRIYNLVTGLHESFRSRQMGMVDGLLWHSTRPSSLFKVGVCKNAMLSIAQEESRKTEREYF